MTKNRNLYPGGFAAALACLFLLACGPGGGDDSGMTDPDAGPMPDDAGPDVPDSDVMPPDGGMDPDAGMDVDGGTVTCSAEQIQSRTAGCGALYDLPMGMPYSDDAMIASCMTTLAGASWGTTGARGCSTDIDREAGTNQWLILLDCPGATDLPYDGIYRLGNDGSFYANWGNAAMVGESGNHGRLTPDADCRGMLGEFYHGGETMPYNTQSYWME